MNIVKAIHMVRVNWSKFNFCRITRQGTGTLALDGESWERWRTRQVASRDRYLALCKSYGDKYA